MPITIIKKSKEKDGKVRHFFMPYYPEDIAVAEKIKDNTKMEVSVVKKRSTKTMGLLQSAVSFFVHNMPEGFHELFGNQYSSRARTREVFWQWLKIQVNYCDVIKVGQDIARIPKPSNFKEQKNEDEFRRSLVTPALEKMANWMNYSSVDEFVEAVKGHIYDEA